MAKRRNLKKEKTSRNQAYARQFRKNSGRSSFKTRRFGGGGRKQEDNEAEGANQDN